MLENDYLAVRNHWISGTLKRVNTYVDSDGVLSHISKESIIELTIFAMVGQLTGPVRIWNKCLRNFPYIYITLRIFLAWFAGQTG